MISLASEVQRLQAEHDQAVALLQEMLLAFRHGSVRSVIAFGPGGSHLLARIDGWLERIDYITAEPEQVLAQNVEAHKPGPAARRGKKA